MKIEKIAKIKLGQDGAIWGGFLFRFDSDGSCAVYTMDKVHANGEAIEPFSTFFLDRIDECIYFSPLSPQSISAICKRQLDHLRGKLSSKEIELSFSPDAVEFISESAKENGGARHIRRRISRLCERPISEKILSGEVTKGSKITLKASEDGNELDIVIQ